jgi:hypothetical protein
MLMTETTEPVRKKRCSLTLRERRRLWRLLELDLKDLEGKGYSHAAREASYFLGRKITVSNVRTIAKTFNYPIKKGSTTEIDSSQERSETLLQENTKRPDRGGETL